MTQTTEHTIHSQVPLPDAFSSALTGIFKQVQPAIVQVHTAGRGGGTGIIWQRDGRIITNHHVVPRDDMKVQVLLADGRTLDARVLSRNPQLDLALLKVDGEHLEALPAGDSSALRIGEWVFAIGHPWGQRWVVTAGVVSTVRTVKLGEQFTTKYIQSDVGLAPGNSGGPLLNADGEVVGVNAMIFGGDLSVSIPSNVVSDWLRSLPKGRITLGIEIQQIELPANIRQQLHPERAAGLLVVGTPLRAAHLNDLLIGDILLDVSGKPVSDAATLRAFLAEGKGGEAVTLRLVRGGQVITTQVITQTVEQAAA